MSIQSVERKRASRGWCVEAVSRFLILMLALSFSVAHAATFTVTNLNDGGAGSLRQAVLDRVGRQTWLQEREKLVNALVRFGIDAKRILYIGAEKNETRLYARESAELLHRFFARYPLSPNGVVFSDNGQSFFPGGVTALESLGFAKHVSYPAPGHQHLSPNDNRLQGPAKARGRNSGVDFEDNVESSLLLLSHLDVKPAAHGAMWFRRSILNLTAKSARELIRDRSGNRAQLPSPR